jgi:hypothetical protein
MNIVERKRRLTSEASQAS